MKLLLFIDSDKIEDFFEIIKNKYYEGFKRFIDYFEKTYMHNNPFNDRQWNYSNFLKNEEDTKKYFYTNNVCESLNRTINSFFKYSRKTFYNFESCIKKIIELYDDHNDYIEKNISITRVFAWYCRNYNINDLKKYDDIDEIISTYKKHFNYDINEDDINDINDSDENIKAQESMSSSNYSSNYFSNSSETDSDNKINEYNQSKKDDNNNDGNEDESKDDSESSNKKNSKNYSKESKNNNKKKDNKNEKENKKKNSRKAGKHQKNLGLIIKEKKLFYEDLNSLDINTIRNFVIKDILNTENDLIVNFEKIDLNKKILDNENKINFKEL